MNYTLKSMTKANGDITFITNMRIGRLKENDMCLENDSSVSSKHAIITVENEKVYIEDLQSTNGTRLNGTIITSKANLHNGDIITFGKASEFVFFNPNIKETSSSSNTIKLEGMEYRVNKPKENPNKKDFNNTDKKQKAFNKIFYVVIGILGIGTVYVLYMIWDRFN